MASYSSQTQRKKRDEELKRIGTLGRNLILEEDEEPEKPIDKGDSFFKDDPDYLPPVMIKNILMMDPKERRKGTVQKLSMQFKKNKFLKEIADTRDPETVQTLYKHLGHTALMVG